MSEPTTTEIRERHERSVYQDEDLIELCDRETWVVDLMRAFNECRTDRGLLLDRLESKQKVLDAEMDSNHRLIAKELEQALTIKRQQEDLDAVRNFPAMLRKMWSGGEVQDWIDRQLAKAEVKS